MKNDRDTLDCDNSRRLTHSRPVPTDSTHKRHPRTRKADAQKTAARSNVALPSLSGMKSIRSSLRNAASVAECIATEVNRSARSPSLVQASTLSASNRKGYDTGAEFSQRGRGSRSSWNTIALNLLYSERGIKFYTSCYKYYKTVKDPSEVPKRFLKHIEKKIIQLIADSHIEDNNSDFNCKIKVSTVCFECIFKNSKLNI